MLEKKLKPNLFYYWEGPQPDWIKLCLKTIMKHCYNKFNVYLLNEKNVNEYTELPSEYWKIEAPNHKTDYLKAKLVLENGGFWIDADTIVLQEFTDWVRYFETSDFIGTPGFFGGPKGSETIKQWYRKAQEIIRDHQKFHFSELIDPLIRKRDWDPFRVLTKKQFIPVWYEAPDIEKFWSTFKEPEDILDETSRVVVLFNNCFPTGFKMMTEKEILKSDMLISKLFRRSLCLSEK